MTQWLAGMRATADRMNDYSHDDSTTSGLTAATGFSVNNFWASRQGATVTLDLYLNRTGADISQTSGNITPDVLAATVPSGWAPNSASTITGIWGNGACSGEFVIGTDGACTLRTASANIASGSNLRFHITFNRLP